MQLGSRRCWRWCATLTPGEMAPEFADAGIELARHPARRGRRASSMGRGAADHPGREAAGLVAGNWPEALVSLPDIYKRGPSAIRGETAQEAVSILEDHGWLLRVEGGAEVGGARRQQVWLVVGKAA